MSGDGLHVQARAVYAVARVVTIATLRPKGLRREMQSRTGAGQEMRVAFQQRLCGSEHSGGRPSRSLRSSGEGTATDESALVTVSPGSPRARRWPGEHIGIAVGRMIESYPELAM